MEKRLKSELNGGEFLGVTNRTSCTMRSIRGKNNRTTERRFRARLVRLGIRGWKIRPNGVEGHPDFAFLKKRIAIFIDGCFWHGCPSCYRPPKRNVSYWKAKVELNKKRDRRIKRLLRRSGWKVLRIWECELLDDESPKAHQLLNLVSIIRS